MTRFSAQTSLFHVKGRPMNSKRIEYINVECLTSKNGYDNSCRLKQVLPLCKKQSYLPAHADCFNSVLWELQQLHVKGWPTNSLKKIEYIFYISCYLFCISCFQRLIYIYTLLAPIGRRNEVVKCKAEAERSQTGPKCFWYAPCYI
jgi:hypothetical protein